MTSGVSNQGIKNLQVALGRLDAWIESQEFRGWDPHDALNSAVLRRIAGNNRLIGMAFVQCLRRSPLNLRSLFGVRKGHNPKAMGLFLSSYTLKFASTREEGHGKRVLAFCDWLIEHALAGFAGPCWGYNFDWPNRAFLAPAGTPTIVNTAFIALAFLDSHELVKDLSGGNATVDGGSNRVDGLSVARGACEFLLQDLSILRSSDDEICFSYTPLDRRFVHNANVLGAWLLAAVYDRTRESRLAESARAATRFTVSRQRGDGSWPYGIGERDQWVDNFHTGYVLVAIKRVGQLLQTDEFDSAVKKGYAFWKEQMLIKDLIPKYYVDQLYPIDIHSVAQAILTHLEFSDIDPLALKKAEQLCQWAIEHMQDPTGFFHYQIHRLYRVRIPYMRWGQAWMQLALTRMAASSCVGNSPRAVSASV